MALKLPDSAVPMGDFPVAKAVDIDFDDGENLQEKLDNGSLGGGGTGGAEKIYTSTPIGTVLSFAGQTPPNGYLLCDGGSYAVADYQDLYNVIGNIYGGDSTNFNVPNLVNKFVQGSDISGTEKQAGLPNITGSLSSIVSTNASGTGFVEIVKTAGHDLSPGSSGAYEMTTNMAFDASKSNPIYGNSDTVQPPALTMTYIIKAFHTNEGVDSSVDLEDNVVNHINNRIENKVNELSDQVEEQVSEEVTEQVNRLINVGTEFPTTETCPIGCWYGMYL